MMGAALTLFAIAALGGLSIAVLRFRGMGRPPTWLALAHGAIAAAALACLAYEAATVSLGFYALAAFVILIAAALGGATLFLGFHLRGKALPIPLVIGHGLIALTGFILLGVQHFQEHQAGLRP